MVSTPKTSNTPPNELNSKVNIMSPYEEFSQFDPQEKSGMYDPYFLYDVLTGNDLFPEAPSYDISPILTSSMTTPSLVVDGMSTPQDPNDSPIFNNAPFSASPSLETTANFFPDLSIPIDTTTRSLMQQISISPSVTIPMDDTPLTTTIHGNSSPSLNIPWATDAASSPDDLSFMSIPSVNSPKSSSFMPVDTSPSSFMSVDTSKSQLSPAATPPPSTTAKPTSSKLGTRHRKRSISEMGKEQSNAADELALKRAKNTDAARRSRLRKVMRMDSLEKQVVELKKENTDLLTRIAVLESEKRGLEDKNAEKESRVKMLELQLAEAHDRLVKKST